MTRPMTNASAGVREQVEAVVTNGRGVRGQVSRLVAESAGDSHLHCEGLIGLCRSALEGAAAAVNRSAPHNPDDLLRQVIDGLADGIGTAALAARLALDEAAGRGRSYVIADLTKLTRDLDAVRDLFAEAVSQAARKFTLATRDELGDLKKHAARTISRIEPLIESVLSAALQHPAPLAEKVAQVGPAASRQALGSLFAAAGCFMTEAGHRLASEAGRPLEPTA